MISKIVANSCGQFHMLRPVIGPEALELRQILTKDFSGTSIGRGERKARIKHQHTRGEVGENVFKISLSGLKLDPARLGDIARVLQLPRHAVEGIGEDSHLITTLHLDAPAEVTSCDSLSPLRQFCERPGKAP